MLTGIPILLPNSTYMSGKKVKFSPILYQKNTLSTDIQFSHSITMSSCTLYRDELQNDGYKLIDVCPMCPLQVAKHSRKNAEKQKEEKKPYMCVLYIEELQEDGLKIDDVCSCCMLVVNTHPRRPVVVQSVILPVVPFEKKEKIHPKKEKDLIMSIKDADDYFTRDLANLMWQSENVCQPSALYMNDHIDMNSRMRIIVVDWMINVCESFSFSRETMYISVNYLDRFLTLFYTSSYASKIIINRSNLQLVGTTCMYIASKFEETSVPPISEFSRITDRSSSRDQILAMETVIVNVLNWQLFPRTVVSWLKVWTTGVFQKNSDQEILSTESFVKCMELLDVCLLDMSYLCFYPSEWAAAALFVIHSSNEEYCKCIESVSGYSQESLSKCIGTLSRFVELINNKNITSKYVTLQSHTERISTMKNIICDLLPLSLKTNTIYPLSIIQSRMIDPPVKPSIWINRSKSMKKKLRIKKWKSNMKLKKKMKKESEKIQNDMSYNDQLSSEEIQLCHKLGFTYRMMTDLEKKKIIENIVKEIQKGMENKTLTNQ